MGRIPGSTTAAVWRERLARFRHSELTVVEFCRRERVSQPSFYQWRKRLEVEGHGVDHDARARKSSGGALGPFVAVNIASSVMAEVKFPNGVRIRVPAANIDGLMSVLRAGNELCLEVPSC